MAGASPGGGRRVAPRRLGRGRRGAPTPKRGGTVVFGPVREPACLATFLAVCRGGAIGVRWVRENVSAGVHRRSATSRHGRGSSRCRLHDAAAVHAHVSPSPRGPWSDGVPSRARDFVFTHSVIRRLSPPTPGTSTSQVRSVRAVDAKTVRVVLRSRRPAGGSSSDACSRSMRSRARSSARSGRTGSTTRRRAADRQRPLPRGALGARQAAHARPKPQLLGAARCLSRPDRHPILQRSVQRPTRGEVLERLRQGEVDFAFARDTGIFSDLRRIPGITVLARPSNGLEHLDIRGGPGSHPALRTSSSVGR